MTDSFTFCQLFLWVWVNDTSQPSPSGRYSFSGSVSVTTHHHIPSTEAVRLFCGSVRQRAAFTFPALSIVLVLVGHLYVLFSGLVGTTLFYHPSTVLWVYWDNTPLPSQHCSLGLLGQHSSTLPVPALWACGQHSSTLPALFSGLFGTTLLYPPSTVLWDYWDNTAPPSQGLDITIMVDWR